MLNIITRYDLHFYTQNYLTFIIIMIMKGQKQNENRYDGIKIH